MNLKLVTESTVNNAERFFVKHLSGCRLLANYGYKELAIIDCEFSKIRSFKVSYPLLMTHRYFNENEQYFSWYCDDEHYICFLSLVEPSSKSFKIDLPEGIFLYPYYVWNNDRLIIASNKNIFFSCDVQNQKLESIDSQIIETKYPFFKEIFYYKTNYRLLYYDFEKEIIVYRTEEEAKVNTIFIKHPIKKMNVQFEAPCAYIHSATYLDGVLILVQDDNFIFYYFDKEFHRIVNTKDVWLFRTADLFKYKGKIYCALLSYFFNDKKQNKIEIYEIEKQVHMTVLLRLNDCYRVKE